MRFLWHITLMWQKRNACRILMGNAVGKKPIGRQRHRRVGYIKMDLRETECCGMDWINMAQERNQWRVLVNMVMNLNKLTN
jgi:hypothetical protein